MQKGLQGQRQFQLQQDITVRQVSPYKTILKSHLNSVETLAAHPSNKTFATGSHDRTIKIWDVEKTKQIVSLHDHKQGVWSLQFSNDGNKLLSGSPDSTILIWDLKKNSVDQRLKAHKDKVYDAKFSHSNKYIASCGVGGQIHIWDVSKLSKPIKTISIKQNFAYCIQWTKNDELIFVTTWQSKIYVIDGKSFQIITCQTVTDRQDSKCQSCTTNFSLFPGRVFVATDRGSIGWYQYKNDTKKLVKETQFTGHMDQCRFVLLHPTRKMLLSTSRDGSVRLWDCDIQGRPNILNNLVFHEQKVTQGVFMDDLIVTCSWDQNVGIWKMSQFLK